MAASRLLQLTLLRTHFQISWIAFKLACLLATINWYAKVFASPQGVDVETNQCYCYHQYNVTLSDVIGVYDV